MKPQHLADAIHTLPLLAVTASTTALEAGAALRQLAEFNGCMVGVIRFSGQTPWERHSGDELLYVLEGAVEVTVLTDDSMQVTTLTEGMIFIVPRDCWHRQKPQPETAIMFLTPAQGTDASWADDPRHEAGTA